jgi:hypothetical protein
MRVIVRGREEKEKKEMGKRLEALRWWCCCWSGKARGVIITGYVCVRVVKMVIYLQWMAGWRRSSPRRRTRCEGRW